MIRGYILRDPTKPRNPPNMPIWCAYPWVDCIIKIPSLAVDSTFTMMADTGATGSYLSVRDAMPILGKTGYRLLRRLGKPKSASGIGGSSPNFEIAAKMILQDEDGTLEGFDFDLAIAKPGNKGGKRLAAQLKLPSLLGRDILCHFRMVMDYHRNQLFLDHN